MGALADRFVAAYNRLDAVLRNRIGFDQEVRFSSVVDRAEATGLLARHDARTLKKLGYLRNAIVHDERFPNCAVAEPHQETVEAIELLLASVDGPRNVLSIAALQPREFQLDDLLRDALRVMRGGDYSQVVVRGEEGLRLLTADGIASWVEGQHDDEIIELTPVKISHVVGHERPRRYKIVPRHMSLSEATAAFEDAASWPNDRLFALLVTQNGRPLETCLGIVTPSDAFRPLA